MSRHAAVLLGGFLASTAAISAGNQDVGVTVSSYENAQYDPSSRTTTLTGKVVVTFPATVVPSVTAASSMVFLATGETRFENLRMMLQGAELTAENALVTRDPGGVTEIRSERILIVPSDQL